MSKTRNVALILADDFNANPEMMLSGNWIASSNVHAWGASGLLSLN